MVCIKAFYIIYTPRNTHKNNAIHCLIPALIEWSGAHRERV